MRLWKTTGPAGVPNAGGVLPLPDTDEVCHVRGCDRQSPSPGTKRSSPPFPEAVTGTARPV